VILLVILGDELLKSVISVSLDVCAVVLAAYFHHTQILLYKFHFVLIAIVEVVKFQ
jgi:hypothetical protein